MRPGQAAAQDWAHRLLAEEARESAGDADAHQAVRVWEKLRLSLVRFAGTDSFDALLRRALALALVDVPDLRGVEFKVGGHLEGFNDFVARSGDLGAEGAIAITSHLLGLLISFLGEPITLRLVRDAWPNVPLVK